MHGWLADLLVADCKESKTFCDLAAPFPLSLLSCVKGARGTRGIIIDPSFWMKQLVESLTGGKCSCSPSPNVLSCLCKWLAAKSAEYECQFCRNLEASVASLATKDDTRCLADVQIYP